MINLFKARERKLSQIKRNEAVTGEPIELQIERLLNNGEMLEGVAEAEWNVTREADGVIAITDIRADRFDLAIDETMRVTRSEKKRLEQKRLKREELIKKQAEEQAQKQVASTSTDTTS